jgi:hypothetical protein
MKHVKLKILHRALGVLAVLLIVSRLAWSQEPTAPDPTADSGTVKSRQSEAQDSAVTPLQVQGPPNPAGEEGLFVRALGSAEELADQALFQWGWISLKSFTVVEMFGQQTLNLPAGEPQPPESGSITQVSALIALDKKFGRARLSLQYQPELFITNGNVYPNVANQNSSIDTSFQLSERWRLSISDALSYYAPQRVYLGPSLYANYFTGYTLHNNYTFGPGSSLTNTFGATATYQWSPRTTVGFGSSFGYENASGSEYAVAQGSTNPQSVSGWFGGGIANVSHQLTEEVTLGASYSAQEWNYTNSSTIAGPQYSNVLQQQFLFTYHQQFTPTMVLSAAIGILASSSNGANLALNFRVTKAFQHSSLAAAYDRGFLFNGVVTAYASNRGDILHTINWTQRFSTSTSVAYFRNINATPGTESGFYAAGQAQYRLAGPLSVFGGISYTRQIGDGVYLLSGKLYFYSFGFQFSPPSRQTPVS